MLERLESKGEIIKMPDSRGQSLDGESLSISKSWETLLGRSFIGRWHYEGIGGMKDSRNV